MQKPTKCRFILAISTSKISIRSGGMNRLGPPPFGVAGPTAGLDDTAGLPPGASGPGGGGRIPHGHTFGSDMAPGGGGGGGGFAPVPFAAG